MQLTTYVLDCESLSRAARGDRMMTARLKDAHASGIRVLTSSMTLVEAYHGQVREAAWRWAMARVIVEPVTRDIADDAISLLRDTGLHGHKYAIDAALAAIVRRVHGGVVVYTSDADDMEKLCGDHARVLALT